MAKHSKRDYKMFKRIVNIFTRKKQIQEEVNATAAITIYTESNGEPFVDVQMKDESDKSIEHLVRILSMYSPEAFVDINTMLKNSCESDLHTKIITRFVDEVGVERFVKDNSDNISNQPCISPSDML